MGEGPVSDVDLVILSELSYLDYNSVYLQGDKMEYRPLKDILNSTDEGELGKHSLNYKNDLKLLRKACEGERFSEVGVGGFLNEADRETQIAAVIFRLSSGQEAVAFRGTDSRVAGWKEDFEMVYKMPVRAQERAVSYINQVGEYLGDKFVVAGHSKGGNLAVYAAMACDKGIRDKIGRVCSFDGPGFKYDVYDSEGFKDIEGRLDVIVPRQSIVGLLLNVIKPYRVVESWKVGAGQHDMLSWKVKDEELSFAKDIGAGAARADEALDRWIGSMSDGEKERLGGLIFSILDADKYETIIDIQEDSIRATGDMVETLRDMEKSDREFLWEMLGRYFKR